MNDQEVVRRAAERSIQARFPWQQMVLPLEEPLNAKGKMQESATGMRYMRTQRFDLTLHVLLERHPGLWGQHLITLEVDGSDDKQPVKIHFTTIGLFASKPAPGAVDITALSMQTMPVVWEFIGRAIIPTEWKQQFRDGDPRIYDLIEVRF